MKEWNKKNKVMQRYDLTAHIYDMQYAEEQTSKIEAALTSIKVENESLVLDVGCGTGLLFKYVRKARTIVGLDISRKILLQAKETAEKIPNVHVVLADVDNMPVKEKIFSHIFAVTLIQNMPNPIKTLNRIKQVAREDSVIVVTGLKKKFTLETFERLLEKTGLDIVALKSEGLKCHVAVCTTISS